MAALLPAADAAPVALAQVPDSALRQVQAVAVPVVLAALAGALAVLPRAVLSQRAVPPQQAVPVARALAGAAHLAVEAVSVEVLLDLLSPQSFSAAMARTTPRRTAPYDPVPKSR